MSLPQVLFPEQLTLNKLDDHINQVWYAIMTMDILEVAQLLDERTKFYNLNKQEFLVTLDEKFRKHRVLKDEGMYLNITKCHKKHKDELLFEFVGIESGINLGLLFDIEDYQVTGIRFCTCLGGVEDLDSYYDW